MVGTAFLGFREKFIALLKSVDDVVIESFRLGLMLHLLMFKRKESIAVSYTHLTLPTKRIV